MWRLRKEWIAIVGVGVLGFHASAAAISWNGTNSGTWTNVANWSTNAYPNNGDTVYLTNNGAAHIVTLDNSITTPGLNALTIGNSLGQTTLDITNCTLVVTNTLNLKGNSVLQIDAGGQFLASTNIALIVSGLSNTINCFNSGSNALGSVRLSGTPPCSLTLAGNGSSTATVNGNNDYFGLAAGDQYTLNITNLFLATYGGTITFGAKSVNSAVNILAGSVWNAGGLNLQEGNGQGTNNTITVNGGSLSNANILSIGVSYQSMTNLLVVTNGGTVYAGSPSGNASALLIANATNENGCVVTITGPNSLFCGNAIGATTNCANNIVIGLNALSAPGQGTGNGMIVNNGAVVTNISTVMLLSSGSFLNIDSGGQLWACALGGGRAIEVGNNGAASTTNFSGTGISLTRGGLLDVGTLVNGLLIGSALTTNCYVTNNAAILQFATASPSITVIATNNGNNLTILNGTISFRSITNANVLANQPGKTSLSNATFVGNNTFMLNGAMNLTNGQAYTFDTVYGPTNWAGLAMVNGTTTYRGGKVTIGVGGWLTVSNTTATIASNLACYGTMSVYNSALSFPGGLVLTNNATLVWTSNSTINVTGNLTLPAQMTFSNASAMASGDSATVLTLSGGSISGSPANWTVYPTDHRLVVQGTNTLSIVPRTPGTMLRVK